MYTNVYSICVENVYKGGGGGGDYIRGDICAVWARTGVEQVSRDTKRMNGGSRKCKVDG